MSLATLLTLTMLASPYYSAAEADAIYHQGVDAFLHEDYASARADFQKLLDHGYGGPDVLYNEGTAALAQGDLGDAVLKLERAKREGGNAEDIDANLAIARSKQLDQVVGDEVGEGFLARIGAATSETVWGVSFMALWAVGFILLILRRYLPTRRPQLALVSALCLLFSLPAGAVLATHAYVQENLHEGVVLSPTLVAREGPEDSARASFEIHVGLKVRILEQEGKFAHIRLANGKEGWAELSGMGLI